jgi:uncharacterized protein DUF4198
MIPRIVAAVVFTLTPAAFAQTYIVPSGDCGAVTLHVNTDRSADQVTRAYVHLPKRRVVVHPAAAGHSLDFTADVPETGLIMATVEFAPATNGNETHAEHAKAFIRCGAPALRDASWTDTGLGLEIVPQWNGLTPLKPGESMRFIAVEEGAKRPVHDAPMQLYRDGEGLVATANPDQSGVASFPVTQPGRYKVEMDYRRPDPKNADHWLSDTSTLTFELK